MEQPMSLADTIIPLSGSISNEKALAIRKACDGLEGRIADLERANENTGDVAGSGSASGRTPEPSATSPASTLTEERVREIMRWGWEESTNWALEGFEARLAALERKAGDGSTEGRARSTHQRGGQAVNPDRPTRKLEVGIEPGPSPASPAHLPSCGWVQFPGGRVAETGECMCFGARIPSVEECMRHARETVELLGPNPNAHEVAREAAKATREFIVGALPAPDAPKPASGRDVVLEMPETDSGPLGRAQLEALHRLLAPVLDAAGFAPGQETASKAIERLLAQWRSGLEPRVPPAPAATPDEGEGWIVRATGDDAYACVILTVGVQSFRVGPEYRTYDDGTSPIEHAEWLAGQLRIAMGRASSRTPRKEAASEAQGEPTLEELLRVYSSAMHAVAVTGNGATQGDCVRAGIAAVRTLCLSRAPSPSAAAPVAWRVHRAVDYESREYFHTEKDARENARLGVCDAYVTPLYEARSPSPALAAIVEAGDAMRSLFSGRAPGWLALCESEEERADILKRYDLARSSLPAAKKEA